MAVSNKEGIYIDMWDGDEEVKVAVICKEIDDNIFLAYVIDNNNDTWYFFDKNCNNKASAGAPEFEEFYDMNDEYLDAYEGEYNLVNLYDIGLDLQEYLQNRYLEAIDMDEFSWRIGLGSIENSMFEEDGKMKYKEGAIDKFNSEFNLYR